MITGLIVNSISSARQAVRARCVITHFEAEENKPYYVVNDESCLRLYPSDYWAYLGFHPLKTCAAGRTLKKPRTLIKAKGSRL